MERLVVVETSKSVEEACRALGETVAAHGFAVIQVHDMRAMLAEKGAALDREVRLFEVCNPGHAKGALEIDVRVSAALPCTISVFSEGEHAKFAFLRPTVVLGMFEMAELFPIAQETEHVLREIVAAAAA